jgi:23S rRNA pseudouridine1911/1915/1917 synthase
MNKIQRQITLSDEHAGERLDQALAKIWADYSRSTLTEWIKKEYITVNGLPSRPRTKVAGGEEVLLDATLDVQTQNKAEDIVLDIIAEDDEIIVINKPAGLIVHPGAGRPSGTLLNALLHHCPTLNTLSRAGIVHRLDKDTTGLLVIAKTPTAHHSLIQQLQARTVKRTYLALVYGELISGGTTDLPIGRHPKQRQKMAINTTGKSAVTHFRIEKKFPDFTLLKVQLETGRTHQIRVHMTHIKHPLVGDQTYGRLYLPKGASEPLKAALKQFKRQALHAYQLAFIHPTTNEETLFTAPLPEDFVALMEQL